MKSQLLSVLSVVGIMGTATSALAANTDVLTLLDDGIGGSSAQAATGTSLDVPPGLIPEATPAGSVSAEPAPAEPSSTNDDSMAPVTSTGGTSVSEPVEQQPSRVDTPGAVAGVDPAAPSTPVVETPAPTSPVDGTTGGSGYGDEDEDEDDDEDDEDDD